MSQRLPNMSLKPTDQRPIRSIVNMMSLRKAITPNKEPGSMARQSIHRKNYSNLGKPLAQSPAPPERANVNNSLEVEYQNTLLNDQEGVRQQECANHPGKQPRFKILSKEVDYVYCQKCAIFLASQGFKVERLVEKPLLTVQSKEGNARLQNQARNFAQRVEKALGQSSQTILQHTLEYKSVSQYYASFIQQLNSYQVELKIKIQIFMDRQRAEINSLFEDFESRIKSNMCQIEKAQKQLEAIVQDIRTNLPTIGELSQLEFKPIMVEYNATLTKFTERVANCNNINYKRVSVLYPKPHILKGLTDLVQQCSPTVSKYADITNESPQLQRQRCYDKRLQTTKSMSKHSSTVKPCQNECRLQTKLTPFDLLSIGVKNPLFSPINARENI